MNAEKGEFHFLSFLPQSHHRPSPIKTDYDPSLPSGPQGILKETSGLMQPGLAQPSTAFLTRMVLLAP